MQDIELCDYLVLKIYFVIFTFMLRLNITSDLEYKETFRYRPLFNLMNNIMS